MNPEISIIIPCYNVEDYIIRTLESILNQNFVNFEIIVINDGSTDNTRNVLNDFYKNKSQIKIIDKDNEGVSKARNVGILEAKGKYIVFIDADDWIDPNFLSEYIYRLDNESNVLVYQGFISKYASEDIIEKLPQRIFVSNEISESICILEEKRCLGGACNKIFIKSIILDNKIFFDEGFSYGEDKIFTLQYMQYINKIVFSEQCAYYYNRQMENSLSRKHHKSVELLKFVDEEFRLFKKLENKFSSKSLQIIINSRYSSFAKYVLLSMYRKHDAAAKKDKIDLRNKIIKFDKLHKRDRNFEIEVPKIINLIYKSDLLMNIAMKVKEKFIKLYLKLR